MFLSSSCAEIIVAAACRRSEQDEDNNKQMGAEIGSGRSLDGKFETDGVPV